MRPSNTPLFLAVTAASNQNSVAQWSEDIIRASFQLVASGTAAGSIQIQASNDQSVGLPANQYQPTNWVNLGSSVAVAGAGVYLTPAVEMSYEYLRLNFTSTATGVQTVAVIADTGVKQAQTITTRADVAGNLNNTYYLLSSVNVVTKAQKNFYLWLDDGGGVDPAIAGRTGIQVVYSDGDTAAAIATAMRSALNALTNDFVATGAGAAVITTDVAFGPVTAAVDGGVPTGFTFGAATLGVASTLNNKYFLLNSANAGTGYYVWMNVDGIGTDPAIAGRTGLPVPFSSGSSAATVGTALATAVDGLANFIATGTTTVTITNSASGPYTPASDVSTGFTFGTTTPSGTVTARMKAMAL